MVNAWEWLEENYPQDGICVRKNGGHDGCNKINNYGKTREQIIKLDISYKSLQGNLDLSGFPNLEGLWCEGNNLTSLNISNCEKLKKLNCRDNYLTQIPYIPNPEQLTNLCISNNNFPPQDLSIFSQFRNLEVLCIGSCDASQIHQGIYNPFFDSLEPLKDLNKLKILNISDTDINNGVEYLPNSLEKINYSSKKRPNSKVKEMEKELSDWITKRWKEITPNSTPELKKDWEDRGFGYIMSNITDAKKEYSNSLGEEESLGLEIDEQVIEEEQSSSEEEYYSEGSEVEIIMPRDQEFEVAEEEGDWKNIRSDFTEELQKDWEERGFSYGQVMNWSSAWGEKFNPQDYEFFTWLVQVKSKRNESYADPQWWSNQSWELEEELRKEHDLEYYQKNIHRGFTLESKRTWETQGFNYEECRGWIEIGLTPQDANFAYWLKEVKEVNAEQVKNNGYVFKRNKKFNWLNLLREEYDNASVIAKQWLEKNYPDKEKTWRIYINQQLYGVLDCREYKNLKYISISSSVYRNKLGVKGGSYRKYYDFYFSGCRNNKTKIIPCILAQDYLNQNYPPGGTCVRKNEGYKLDNFGKTREEIKGLDISCEVLEGTLDLSDFKNLECLICLDNYLTSLKVNECKKLKQIYCPDNQLTTLDLGNLEELEELRCHNNYLAEIIYPTNPEKITSLNVISNNLSSQDLSDFSGFRNLVYLYIGNSNKNKISQGIYNRFYGSLEPLKDLNKLKVLDISNTDIDSGVEYSPDNLEKGNFYHDTELRPDCKLAQIQEQWNQELWKDIHEDFAPKHKKDWLEFGFSKEQSKKFLEEWKQLRVRPEDAEFINWFLNFKKLDLEWAKENEEEFKELRDSYHNFGTCKKCQHINTNHNQCQNCVEKEWQTDIENLNGKEVIEKFIQKHDKNLWDGDKLKWIPYEEFTDIEYLAEGGFSKVYKVKWGKWEDGNDKMFALKILNNSQNITLDFLQEIANTKLVDRDGGVVKCNGVSQDPKTGNYIMVMMYMDKGNLRQWLQNKNSKLDLENKILSLKNIALGLSRIHQENLLHRDFHSGNILKNSGEHWNTLFTDLGLSCPANYQKNKGQIFGVLPYVAPEVLRGQLYTPKADIYSFGIVAYELLANAYPYSEMDDTELAFEVCQGLRPNIDEISIPQFLKNLIKRCWDANPENRPNAEDLFGNLKNSEYKNEKLEQEYNTFSQNTSYQIHDNATLHSKLINTKQIVELLKRAQKPEENTFNLTKINEPVSLEKEIEKIEAKIGKPLENKLKELAKSFIKANQKAIKNLESEAVKEVREIKGKLENELKEADFSEEEIENFIEFCRGCKVSEELIERSDQQNFADNWWNIHPSFTSELIQSWKNLNFNYQQARDWINIGFKPEDYELVNFVKNNLKYDAEEVLNNVDFETLNLVYQDYKEQQNISVDLVNEDELVRKHNLLPCLSCKRSRYQEKQYCLKHMCINKDCDKNREAKFLYCSTCQEQQQAQIGQLPK